MYFDGFEACDDRGSNRFPREFAVPDWEAWYGEDEGTVGYGEFYVVDDRVPCDGDPLPSYRLRFGHGKALDEMGL